MTEKPLLVLDQHFRRRDELFSTEAFGALEELCSVVGGEDRPMPADMLSSLLPRAEFLVAARPALRADDIARAARLRAIVEVSGAFHAELDYEACFDRGIEVLSSAPGFGPAVAEMGLGLILAAARGLVAEHEAFRAGKERWLDDRTDRDFSLFGQRIGFVGYGNIARRLHDLLRPFSPRVSAFDPWLDAAPSDVALTDLDRLCRESRVLVVTAVPTGENRHIVSGDRIASMPDSAALVLLSRAHLVDFDAAVKAADRGRITFATDVFPMEPLPDDAPIRGAANVVLSPHRAAAVDGGRQPIGDMICHDIRAILTGEKERRLLRADPERVAALVAGQREIASGTASGWRV